jgi:hypothetical protein
MEFFDRVLETTTFSGSLGVGSNITINLGALSSKFLRFQDRFTVGDPVHFTFEDANGLNWIDCDATLTSTTQLTVTLVEDGTNGPGAAVTMSAGTHRIGNTVGAYGQSKRAVFGDHFIDHVASGLIITDATSGGVPKINISAGICYANGMRVRKGGVTALTLTASRDVYLDVKWDGSLNYSGGNTVANLAGAPALVAGSTRIGKVVTNASAVSTITQDGTIDSQGNCLYNPLRLPFCRLAIFANQTIPIGGGYTMLTFAGSTVAFDNDGMSNLTGHPTRIAIQRSGFYVIKGFSQIESVVGAVCSPVSIIYTNGVQNGQSSSTSFGLNAATASYPQLHSYLMTYIAAGSYVELGLTTNDPTNAQTCDFRFLEVIRVG